MQAPGTWKQQKCTKQNNAGFSLVELIAVIAIIMILSGSALLALNSLTSGKVRKCAQTITDTLKTTKTNALCKSQAYMEIYYDPGTEEYRVKDFEQRNLSLGGKQITISYQCENEAGTTSAAIYTVSDGHPLILSFQRGTGAFRPIITSISGSTYTYRTDSSGSNMYCSKIDVTAGTRSRTITLARATGKVTLNNN